MSNFSMRAFVKRGLLNAVGKQPDYWIIQTATGWCEKSVLELSDLEEIQSALDAKDAESNTKTAVNSVESVTDSGENAVNDSEIVTDDSENAVDDDESADGATP